MEGSGPRRFDGYVRVSRVLGRSGPAYISPTVQREAIQRWADFRGVEIVAWHIDEDQSGGTQDRPGLKKALERVEAGETGGIACWRLNRFARNVAGAIHDVQRIQKAGGQLALVEEQIDPTGPFGTFLLTVLLAVATLERDNAVAGFEEAKRRAVERGAYISRTPFGYQRNPDGTLSPHPEKALIVTEAFRLAATSGLHAAMRHLQRTVPERDWTTTKVRRLIRGRSYLGETRNGEIVRTGTHDPLVSRAVWEAAQTSPQNRLPKGDFPLSGLLRCGTCDAPMVGSRGGKGQRTYRCAQTISTARTRCPKGAVITATLVEDYLRDVADKLMRQLEVTVSDPEVDALTLLERAIADAEAELDAFAADLTMRRALGDRYHSHLELRVQAVEKARASYREKAQEAQATLLLGSENVLDDPELFPLALRNIFSSIVVQPGRGLKVADRVVFPGGADRPAGVAGA